ncbi:hypothetical protein D3C87_1959250 [compost metagenome]
MLLNIWSLIQPAYMYMTAPIAIEVNETVHWLFLKEVKKLFQPSLPILDAANLRIL